MAEPLIKTSYNPTIDNPELAKEIQEDNLEFKKEQESATPEKTEEMKEGLRELLYGIKSNNDYISGEQMHEEIAQNQKTEEQIQDEIFYSKNEQFEDTGLEQDFEKLNKKKIDEHPKTPLIESLVDQNLLTIEEGEEVKNLALNDTDFVTGIDKLEGIPEDKKSQILDSISYLEGEEGKNKCREKFNNDLKDEIDLLKVEVAGGEKLEKELTEGQSRLVDKLGGNYFSVGNPSGAMETDKEALNKAFKITLNEFINNKQFKEPENFDNIKSAILDPNIDFKTRFTTLQKIESQIVNSTSSRLDKQNNAFKKGKEKIKDKQLTNDAKMKEYRVMLEQSLESKDALALKELKSELIELKEDTPKGGAIEASILDLINEVELGLQEQAA